MRHTERRSTKRTLDAVERHPLREDIVAGLTGLLAARGIDFGEVVAPRAQLSFETALANAHLPASQVAPAALETQEHFPGRSEEILDIVSTLASRPGHPLNARILDQLLGGLAVWQRDLTWTEWTRRSPVLRSQVDQLAERWRDDRESADDDAALVLLTWLLTSTDRPLRDGAIHALYRLGVRRPDLLFARALELLDLNDPTVAEGLLAASYGVAMAAQDPAFDLEPEVVGLARELQARLLDESATRPSAHWLIREYAYRIVQLADWLTDGSLEGPRDAAQPQLPAPPGEVPAFEKDDEGWRAVDGAFGMDFSNYTVGSLIEDRDNYDSEHLRYVKVMGEIRARVADLGWTEERFGELNTAIGHASFTRENDPSKVERYGKKYGWVGFYEAAGRLSDSGELRPNVEGVWRLSEVPIDPSFPQNAPPLPETIPDWIQTSVSDDEGWVRKGSTPIPDQLFRTPSLPGGGQWVAVDGYLRQQEREGGRRVFCFLRGLLALKGWASVKTYVDERGTAAETVRNDAADYYCFAGEAPWAATFDSFAACSAAPMLKATPFAIGTIIGITASSRCLKCVLHSSQKIGAR